MEIKENDYEQLKTFLAGSSDRSEEGTQKPMGTAELARQLSKRSGEAEQGGDRKSKRAKNQVFESNTWTQKDTARALGISQSTVSKCLKIAELSQKAISEVISSSFSEFTKTTKSMFAQGLKVRHPPGEIDVIQMMNSRGLPRIL